MSNFCDFSMKVSGTAQDVNIFYSWLSAYYDYSDTVNIHVYHIRDMDKPCTDDNKFPVEHHIGYRVFESYINFEDGNSRDYLMWICGSCAWSVYSCMFKDEVGTYMGDVEYGRSTDKVISLTDASKELGLKIEVFSSEPGNGFSEHYYIDNGEIICEEESDFHCLYLEYFNKDNEEFDEETYNSLDDETKGLIETALEDGVDILSQCLYWDNVNDDWRWEYL